MSTPIFDRLAINEPDSPLVLEALARRCDCGAKVDEPCRNTIHPGEPLPGRQVHFSRLCERPKGGA